MKSANKSIDLLAWAATLETGVLEAGRSLAHWQTADALQVGVRFPRRVRVLLVDALPAPGDPELRAAAETSGWLDESSGYLTMGYAILIHRRCVGSRRILRHALRAVAEFELAGSLHTFLSGHLDPMVGADIPAPCPANDDLADARRWRTPCGAFHTATTDFSRLNESATPIRVADLGSRQDNR